MPTNNERREMAAKLRDLDATEDPIDGGEIYDRAEVEDALGLVTDDGAWYEGNGVQHLADLIEPAAKRTCHNDLKDSDCVGVWPKPHFKCSWCHGLFASYEFYYCPCCGAKVVNE